ncbi:AAA family ATPase [Thioclava sp. IC9]|uniref:AAA family ATPase n=2 Tax=Thioclava TaxID=285107 RepID=UPI000B539DD8|nr:AAA family ATPase [Thioclava sp. IC9]OWY06886.1 hypothetical protein B6V76_03675 [Thioclava sp. IC9]
MKRTKITPAPPWAPFAEHVIARLRLRHALILDSACENPGEWESSFAEDTNGPAPVEDWETVGNSTGENSSCRPPTSDRVAPNRGATGEGDKKMGPSDEPDEDPADIAIPTNELLIALQLAAAFGNETEFREQLAQGAITVLHGLHTDDIKFLTSVIEDAMLPPGWALERVVRGSPHQTLLFAESGVGAALLPERLALRAPLFIAHIASRDLPNAYLRPPCKQVTFLPPDADVLMFLLRASRGDMEAIDEEAIRATLPSPEAMAKFSREQWLIALRAPTAHAVAERFAGFTENRAGKSFSGRVLPDLEAMAKRTPVHAEAWRMVRDLAAWKAGEVDWSELTRSLLLHGAPGTGKTWIAQAMGKSAGVALVQTSFAEWQAEGHLGHMLAAMRKSFAEARAAAPCVMFIDEIDAVGSREDRDPRNRNYRDQVINAFLEEVDALSREPGVLLVGACNYPTRIDPAILRPGRFDVSLEVPLPDRHFLEAMLRDALAGTLTDADFAEIARVAVGHTPASLDAAIRAAKSEARHSGRMLDAPMLRTFLGHGEGTSGDLKRIAMHEAGHAVVAELLRPGSVRRVQVSPLHGFIERAPAPVSMLLADIEDQVVALLAGRAAEHVLLGTVSNGSGGGDRSDLAHATELCMAIEHRYGMGSDGLLWSPEDVLTVGSPRALRSHVRKRLDTAWQRACDLVRENVLAVERVGNALIGERELCGETLHELTTETSEPDRPERKQARPGVE